MTTHEVKKRELAKAATPGPWRWVEDTNWNYDKMEGAQGRRIFDDGSAAGEYCSRIDNENDPAFIAFHDPTTALLEADVIAAVRDEDNYVGGIIPIRIKRALAALDAHAAKKEKGE